MESVLVEQVAVEKDQSRGRARPPDDVEERQEERLERRRGRRSRQSTRGHERTRRSVSGRGDASVARVGIAHPRIWPPVCAHRARVRRSHARRRRDAPRMCRPYPCRERLLATATKFHGALTGSRTRSSPSISVRSSTPERRPPVHEYRRVVARRRPRPRALQTLATTINTRARALSHRPPHTLLPAPPRSTPRLPRSPTVASTCVRRVESNQRHAAASASAAAFAGKPFPTNASLAALAHASYAATSAPHRSVSAAFSS